MRRRNDEGVALLLALLIIVLLTVIIVEFSYEAQVQASYTASQSNDLELYLAARTGIARGMALLAEDLVDVQLSGGDDVDSYMDPVPWSMGVPFEQIDEVVMRSSVSDESGKINLNALVRNGGNQRVIEDGAPQQQQQQEGETPQAEEELRDPSEYLVEAMRTFFALRDPDAEDPTDAILDWLDYGSDDDERPQGAEDEFYRGLEIPYACKNGPMDSLDELLLIKGITPKLFYGDPEDDEQFPLSEYFTVHGDWQGRVNVNTARPEVLEAVIESYVKAGLIDAQPQAVSFEIFERVTLEQPYMNLSDLDEFLPVREQQPTGGRRNNRRNPTTTKSSSLKELQNVGGGLGAGSGTGSGDGTGGTGGGTGTGTGTGRAGGIVSQMFTVKSNTFRIYGDAMLAEKLLRIEAYVYRTPIEAGGQPVEAPSENASGGNRDSGPPTGDGTEPFRILQWTVIR